MVLNKKEIEFGKSKFLVIELSEPLSEETEVYPGDPRLEKQVLSTITLTGYEHYKYTLSNHNFHPHGDAPKHQNKDAANKGFEIFGLDFCFNSALLIDLENVIEIKKSDLEPFSSIIRTKGALIVRTGYDRHLEKNNPHVVEKIPYFTKDAADFISQFENLKVIGTDSISVDSAGSHYAHQKFKNLLIVESLMHLYEVNTLEFFLETAPIRIKGATGGPIAAYAFIERV